MTNEHFDPVDPSGTHESWDHFLLHDALSELSLELDVEDAFQHLRDRLLTLLSRPIDGELLDLYSEDKFDPDDLEPIDESDLRVKSSCVFFAWLDDLDEHVFASIRTDDLDDDFLTALRVVDGLVFADISDVETDQLGDVLRVLAAHSADSTEMFFDEWIADIEDDVAGLPSRDELDDLCGSLSEFRLVGPEDLNHRFTTVVSFRRSG